MAALAALSLLAGVGACAHPGPAARTPAAAAAPRPPGWTTVETARFAIDVPPGWLLVQSDEWDFGLLSGEVVDGFLVNVAVTVFAQDHAPRSLDDFVTRILASVAVNPQLTERVLTRERIAVDGRPAERVTTVGGDNMRYLTTLTFADGVGFGVAGEASESAFERFAPIFRAVGDSLRVGAHSNVAPLPVKVLLMPEQFGGEDRRENRVWLYPKAAAAKDAVDARVRELVMSHGDEGLAYAATPRYPSEKSQLASSVVIEVRSPTGATLLHEEVENVAR
jgi:hypothetical protein